MTKRKSMGPRLRRIKMLLLDVDGVLTDGGLYYSADGVELKRFHAHDGYGVARAFARGLKIGLISGRTTSVVTARAVALGIEDVIQGAQDKVTAMRSLQEKYHFTDEEFAFMGDELFDMPLLKVVGFAAAPKNARPEVRRIVQYVTRVAGGDGAAREVIDLILTHQQRRRQ